MIHKKAITEYIFIQTFCHSKWPKADVFYEHKIAKWSEASPGDANKFAHLFAVHHFELCVLQVKYLLERSLNSFPSFYVQFWQRAQFKLASDALTWGRKINLWQLFHPPVWPSWGFCLRLCFPPPFRFSCCRIFFFFFALKDWPAKELPYYVYARYVYAAWTSKLTSFKGKDRFRVAICQQQCICDGS